MQSFARFSSLKMRPKATASPGRLRRVGGANERNRKPAEIGLSFGGECFFETGVTPTGTFKAGGGKEISFLHSHAGLCTPHQQITAGMPPATRIMSVYSARSVQYSWNCGSHNRGVQSP